MCEKILSELTRRVYEHNAKNLSVEKAALLYELLFGKEKEEEDDPISEYRAEEIMALRRRG